jgi:hypothetical protein
MIDGHTKVNPFSLEYTIPDPDFHPVTTFAHKGCTIMLSSEAIVQVDIARNSNPIFSAFIAETLISSVKTKTLNTVLPHSLNPREFPL